MSERVEIFTDGACKGNPGPGGWGALLRIGAHVKELHGGVAGTTNNRMELTAVIRALEALSRRALTRDESAATFTRFMASEYSDIEMAAILAAIKTRGETPEVMAGAVEALLASAVHFPRPAYPYADCCGTGGDGTGTVNISTAAAFVAAEMGIPIAKTGNRSVSSRCGSADVLEKLGVRLDPDRFLPPFARTRPFALLNREADEGNAKGVHRFLAALRTLVEWLVKNVVVCSA